MTLQLRNRTALPPAPDGGLLGVRACPAELEHVIELGAERFLLRPMRLEDSRAYSDFIAGIDHSDLRRRFGQSASDSPDLERDDSIDYDRGDMAFIAIRLSGPDTGEIVGEVRAHRYPDAAAAEVAIIVRSDMRGRGLGRALLEKMIGYCRAQGLDLIAQIMLDNKSMIRLAQRCGMQLEYAPGSNLAIAHLGADT
jgi:acetyltransferase